MLYENTTGAPPRPPVRTFLRRYEKNRAKAPWDRFSVLNETALEVVGPMEVAGYTVSDKLCLDNSVGQLFCRYLRSKGIGTDSFDTYLHEYEDGRIVKANLYPIELVGEFRRFVREVWLPTNAPAYFKKRAPDALRYLPTSATQKRKNAA